MLKLSDDNMLDNEMERTEEVRWMLGAGQASRVLPLLGTLPDGRNLVVLAREKSILPDYEAEDLLDDRECFGVVERIVPVGGEVDLRRFLFSGLNRTIRRSMEKQLDEAVTKMAEFTGGDHQSLQIAGPAIVVRAVAIA